MIKITVELIGARTGVTRVLGVATVANDGLHTAATNGARGSYSVRLSKWAPKESQIWKQGVVADFDRKHRGVWDLLYLGLRNIVGSRNP